MGYFFYFFYMVVAFLLLMNMLLAILVDAYISIRKDSDSAAGVITDMVRQAKANTRAVTKPKVRRLTTHSGRQSYQYRAAHYQSDAWNPCPSLG